MSNNTPFHFKNMAKIYKNRYQKTLKEMADIDQRMRKDFRVGKLKWTQKIDKVNSTRMEKIISKIGWPTSKKVGIKGERCAWLIVQHSPNIHFQKRCLLLMKREGANKKFIAFLEDRLRISDNKKQLYGTQFYIGDKGNLEPRPIYNPRALESRRKKVGLGSFKKYKEKIMKSFTGHILYTKKFKNLP